MSLFRRKYAVLAALVAVPVLAAACSGTSEGVTAPVSAGDTAEPAPVTMATGDVASTLPKTPAESTQVGGSAALPEASPTPVPGVDEEAEYARSRFPSYWETDYSKRSVSFREIRSGGPPRDGIPPVYNPEYESVEEAGRWLFELEPVIVVQVNGEVRAYPQSIMFREMVDDVLGGKAIAVTWCPLCNTALVFDREVDGRVFTFGVSGLLRQSNLIMWDHETQSWWQQGTAEAIVGEMTGARLKLIPSQVVTWRDFKAAFPKATVLAAGSEHGYNPYFGYDTSLPFLFEGPIDGRLRATERVIGIRIGGDVRAYPYEELSKARVVQERRGGRNLVIFYEPSGLSTLDEVAVSLSRSVGTAAVFLSEVEGRLLTFEFRDDAFVDVETGSRWNILGQAEEGPLQGETLAPLFHHQAFWFYWTAIEKGSTIYRSPE